MLWVSHTTLLFNLTPPPNPGAQFTWARLNQLINLGSFWCLTHINQSNCNFPPLRSRCRGTDWHLISRITLLPFEMRATTHCLFSEHSGLAALLHSVSCLCPRSLPEVFCSLETFSPSLICMVSVCSFVITDFFPEGTNLTTLLWSLSVFVKCIDLFFCCFAVFFYPSSCGHRMTQIGNTISGVTGLRSVWWMLVTLSPSLLTPGSKCMHGRSEVNALHKLKFPFLFSFTSFSNPICFLHPHTESHRAAITLHPDQPARPQKHVISNTVLFLLKQDLHVVLYKHVFFHCGECCVFLPTKQLCLEHSTQTNFGISWISLAKPSFFLVLKGLYSKFTFVVTLTFSLTPLRHLIHGNQADLQASSKFARHHP